MVYTPKLYGFVSVGRCWGGGGLLKCHTLCPIWLTFLVVHFYTHIYVSILNLCPYLLISMCLIGAPPLSYSTLLHGEDVPALQTDAQKWTMKEVRELDKVKEDIAYI